MKRVMLSVIVFVIAGCSSFNYLESKSVSVNAPTPAAVCASLGINKAANNIREVNNIRLQVKQRIKEGSFNIKPGECEEIALNSIGAYKLISVDAVLI